MFKYCNNSKKFSKVECFIKSKDCFSSTAESFYILYLFSCVQDNGRRSNLWNGELVGSLGVRVSCL